MPIQCHTLNKAASKQFSFELAPKLDCFLCQSMMMWHTLAHIHTHTWERRRIEMKAKVAFDPQTKVAQRVKYPKRAAKLKRERNRTACCGPVKSLFARKCNLHLYVCRNTMPIASHTCIQSHTVAKDQLQEATGGQRTLKTTEKGQEYPKYTSKHIHTHIEICMCKHII